MRVFERKEVIFTAFSFLFLHLQMGNNAQAKCMKIYNFPMHQSQGENPAEFPLEYTHITSEEV